MALACAILAATLAAGLPAVPVRAQQGGESRVFEIPAESLADGLTSFGRQSGWQVSVHDDLIKEARTRGVHGSMVPEQALRLLLAGTGFDYELSGGNTVTLRKLPPAAPAQPGVIELGPVRVDGQVGAAADPQNPVGPGVGYVATRSVAGTKTGSELLDTPQTINVVTREQMDTQQVVNVLQALRYTPGVGTELGGVDTRIETNQILIRGFSPDEYLDGLKLPMLAWASPQIDPWGLDRVEVLKGPSSVLYGQASPGGLLDLTSKRPGADPIHQVALTGGSYGFIQGAVDVGGALDDAGHFSFRLNAIGRDSGTQVDHNGLERYSVSPAFAWKPDDRTSLTILGNFQKDPEAGAFNQLPVYGTLIPIDGRKISTSFYGGEPDTDKYVRTQGYAGYIFEHDFGDGWSVRQNFRYMHVDGDFITIYPYGQEPDGRTLDRGYFGETEHLDAVSLDNQLQGNFSTGAVQHTLLVGVDYQHGVDRGATRDADAPSIDVFAPIYGPTLPVPPIDSDRSQTQNQTGLYAQDQVKLNRWTLTLSLREDWANQDTEDKLAGVTSSSQSESAFTWRTGLNYRFDNGIAPYFSYSKSFQPTAGTDYFLNAFKPTTGEQYEAGVKFQPAGVNALFTAAGFQLTQQNVLTPDPDPTHVGYSIQTGEVRVRGAELEGKVSLADGLNLIAAYTYLDPEVTKANDDTLGKQPAALPDQTASVWADYNIREGRLAGLALGGGVRWIGESYANPVNSAKVPSHTLVDLTARYDLGRISSALDGAELSVNVTNLFDKQYLAECDGYGCEYGLRRAVYSTLRYRW